MDRVEKDMDSKDNANGPILIIANKIPRESPSQFENLYKSVVNILTVKADLKFTTTKIFNTSSTSALNLWEWFHGTIMALFPSKPIIFTEYVIYPGLQRMVFKCNQPKIENDHIQFEVDLIEHSNRLRDLSKFEHLKMIKINDKNLSNRNRNRSEALKTEFKKVYILHPKKLNDVRISGHWWFPNIIRTTVILEPENYE